MYQRVPDEWVAAAMWYEEEQRREEMNANGYVEPDISIIAGMIFMVIDAIQLIIHMIVGIAMFVGNLFYLAERHKEIQKRPVYIRLKDWEDPDRYQPEVRYRRYLDKGKLISEEEYLRQHPPERPKDIRLSGPRGKWMLVPGQGLVPQADEPRKEDEYASL